MGHCNSSQHDASPLRNFRFVVTPPEAKLICGSQPAIKKGPPAPFFRSPAPVYRNCIARALLLTNLRVSGQGGKRNAREPRVGFW
jgi:hypothetical protein